MLLKMKFDKYLIEKEVVLQPKGVTLEKGLLGALNPWVDCVRFIYVFHHNCILLISDVSSISCLKRILLSEQ